jgi:hypothetical protein
MSRLIRSLEALASGTLVYILVVACGSAPATHRRGSAGSAGVALAGSGGAAGSPGEAGQPSGGSAGASLIDAAVDALTHPESDAQAATESGTRLRAVYMTGSDGSRELVGWHDREQNVKCRYGLMSDGTQRCIPILSYDVAVLFSDGACTQPVFKSDCKVPSTFGYAQSAGASCDYAVTYRVFKRVSDSPITVPYAWTLTSSGNCAYLGASTSQVYSATELKPSDFVQGTEQIDS